MQNLAKKQFVAKMAKKYAIGKYAILSKKVCGKNGTKFEKLNKRQFVAKLAKKICKSLVVTQMPTKYAK